MLLGRERVIKLYIVAQRINKQAVLVQATSASVLVVGASGATTTGGFGGCNPPPPP